MVATQASGPEAAEIKRAPQYDALHFAARYGVSMAAAREILRTAGQSREDADTAILRMRQAAAQVEA